MKQALEPAYLLGFSRNRGENVTFSGTSLQSSHNTDKIHVYDMYGRQEVTGIVVNSFPNLKREYIREIRTILHDCEINGVFKAALKYIQLGKTNNVRIKKLAKVQYAEKEKQEKQKEQIVSWFSSVLKGKIEYIRCVRGDDCSYFFKYGSMYNNIFQTDIFTINDFENKMRRWCFVIEGGDDNKVYQGSGFLLKGYGIITNEHVLPDDSLIYSVKDEQGNQITSIHKGFRKLYRNKAKHIMGLSQKLLDDFDGEVPCDREALMTLPGVGRKTANVVLNVIFHQSTMPVDTHLLRISPKIGLAQGSTPEAVEQSLLSRIPPEFLPNAHHWILLHGRYICTARTPKCSECLISDLCKKNFE